MRGLIALFAAAAAVVPAAPATAAPQCSEIAPNTRMCARPPGHTAITSTPNPAYTNPYPGWGFGWGTPVFGLGGGGIWIGI